MTERVPDVRVTLTAEIRKGPRATIVIEHDLIVDTVRSGDPEAILRDAAADEEARRVKTVAAGNRAAAGLAAAFAHDSDTTR